MMLACSLHDPGVLIAPGTQQHSSYDTVPYANQQQLAATTHGQNIPGKLIHMFLDGLAAVGTTVMCSKVTLHT